MFSRIPFHPAYHPEFLNILLSFLITQFQKLKVLPVLCYSLGSACGSHSNRTLSQETSLTLRNGTNYISLLSVMVGMPVVFNLIFLILSIRFYALGISEKDKPNNDQLALLSSSDYLIASANNTTTLTSKTLFNLSKIRFRKQLYFMSGDY